MFIRNTVADAAEAVAETVNPAELVTLAELAAEGFGYGSPFVNSPKDAVDALERQLDGVVVLDDLGRRCTDRDTARRLFAERAAAEERQRVERQRREEELAKRQTSPPRGVPAGDGLTAYESMLAASGADERKKDRAGERTAALMRGESFGEFYIRREGEE
jgi:hypothetical protein